VITVEAHVAKLPEPRIESEVLVTADVVLCIDGDEARCVPARGWYRLPITLDVNGDGALGYVLPVTAP
jgi:hypothetical protein